MATYDYINAQGAVIPDTSIIKEEVEAEYKGVYGEDFVVESSSEQGRQIDAEITSRMSVVRTSAKLANQINPNFAESVFLDAIYAFSSGERDAAERSTVQLTATGLRGTVIPVGSKAEDVDGNLWESAAAMVIPASLSIEGSFFSVEYGAIYAAAGDIDTIVDDVLGWETITNTEAATVGKLEQNDVSTRRQRKVELAGNAVNNTYAIMTAVSKVEGVNSLSFRENNTDSILDVDGVTMTKRSTYVCVDGGTDSEIAEAYYKARSGGTGFNGNVTSQITDPESLQVFDVKFSRPDDKPKLVRITVKSTVGIDPVDSIKTAIVNYSNGLVDSEQGFVVGGDVSAFEISSAVSEQVAGVFVSKCEIAENTTSPIYTTDTITTEIYEKASITVNDIQVIEL